MDSSLEFGNFLRLVVDALDASGVDYMIVGAGAVWAWGEPRTTAELFLLRPKINDEYAMTAFSRRVLLDLGPPLGEVYVKSPENLILNKLRFFKISHQPKHTRDIARITLELDEELDRAYIESWAARMNTLDIWDEILRALPSPSTLLHVPHHSLS